MEGPQKYHCEDEELGALLHRLFVEQGETEVEIHHPTEGVIIYTADQWRDQLDALKRMMEMSPAERIQETKKLKARQQNRFRTAMVDAEVRTIDIEDEDVNHFGLDVDGKEIDMNGMIFTPTNSYPKGTRVILNEIGAFVDESMRKPPIRILAQPKEDDRILN